MNTRTWSMDGLDFVVLCHRYGRDRLPYPLRVRIDADGDQSYRQLREGASARIDAVLDDDLDAAIRAVVDPIVRIECHGTTTDPRFGVFRSHAAVRHDLAAVVTQQPGPDDDSGGRITIELSAPETVPTRVIAALPPCPAGRRPNTRLRREPVAAGSARRPVTLSTATRSATSEEQFQDFFGRTRTAIGEVIIARGKTFDSRPDTDAQAFFWMDFEGDGRYVVYSADTIDIAPADASGMASEIRRHLYDALRR